VFGSGADTSKVDGLFNALDANSDGSVSLDELTSAAQQAKGHHRHLTCTAAERGTRAD
jgi:Ca2+-binding EF-hand superfamily protein